MFIFTYMWNNVAVFTKEQLFAQNNSERENAIDSGTYLYSEKWNFTDLRKCYYEMSRALRLPRVMSKFWIYLSYNKTRQFTISSFHSFLMWASRLFQTGQALNLKEGICFTFLLFGRFDHWQITLKNLMLWPILTLWPILGSGDWFITEEGRSSKAQQSIHPKVYSWRRYE